MVLRPQYAVGIASRDLRRIGTHDANVPQPQHRRQRLAIAQRLAEQLAGIEEDDRRGGVRLRHEVEHHRRLRAEGGADHDASGELVLDHDPQQIDPVEPGMAPLQLCRAQLRPSDAVVRGLVHDHATAEPRLSGAAISMESSGRAATSRKATTLPTMISVGAVRPDATASSGKVASVPATTR